MYVVYCTSALNKHEMYWGEEEAQDQVYRELHFDLCPECQQEYLRSPLGIEREET